MGLAQNIRYKLGTYLFNRQVRNVKQKRQVVGFDEAKKIGVLYNATDERNFEIVKQYVKSIRSQQKDILALGYVDKKNLPNSQYAQYGLDFFTRRDLNWQMIPNNTIVHNFIHERFDILINLDNNECFPLRYIAAVSHALFRLGRFDKRDLNCYDMMIQVKSNLGIKDFIAEAENYLRQIKSRA